MVKIMLILREKEASLILCWGDRYDLGHAWTTWFRHRTQPTPPEHLPMYHVFEKLCCDNSSFIHRKLRNRECKELPKTT